MEENGKGEKG